MGIFSVFVCYTIKKGTAMCKKMRLFSASLVMVLMCVCAGQAHALRLSMKRIVLDDKKKAETITIINDSAVEQTYRMGLRHYTFSDTGNFMAIEDDELENYPDIQWADDYLSYAPRRITVPAGGSQQVRLFAKVPRGAADGEYRSHMWITTEAKPKEFKEKNSDKGKEGSSVRLVMQPGVSLPVIIRKGPLESQVEISNASLAKGEGKEANTLVVNFDVKREGSQSVYGGFDITCLAGDEDFVAKKVRGYSLYRETKQRSFKFALEIPEGKSVSDCAKVRIEYKSDSDNKSQNGHVMATAEVAL